MKHYDLHTDSEGSNTTVLLLSKPAQMALTKYEPPYPKKVTLDKSQGWKTLVFLAWGKM